jgi:hypothetical protein
MYGNQPPSNPYGAPQPVLGQTPMGRQRLVVTNVDSMSIAKIYAIMGVVMGVFVGVLVMMFGGMIAAMSGGGRNSASSAAVGGIIGAAAIIIYPIVYGIGGFLSGLIGGALYNLCSKWVGGVQYEVEQTY